MSESLRDLAVKYDTLPSQLCAEPSNLGAVVGKLLGSADIRQYYAVNHS